VEVHDEENVVPHVVVSYDVRLEAAGLALKSMIAQAAECQSMKDR
jgi:hypothetical protein